MQQNPFPSPALPAPSSAPWSIENHSDPSSTWQPLILLKTANHVLGSPRFSWLNSPRSTPKVINLPYLSTCLSQRNKRYFNSHGSSICSAPWAHKERKIHLPQPRPDTERNSIPFGIPLGLPAQNHEPVTVAHLLWALLTNHDGWGTTAQLLASGNQKSRRNVESLWTRGSQCWLPDRIPWEVFHRDNNVQAHSPTHKKFWFNWSKGPSIKRVFRAPPGYHNTQPRWKTHPSSSRIPFALAKITQRTEGSCPRSQN